MLAGALPGFLGSPPVQTALVAGALVALTSGATGVFTVIRGQSFAGHAFSDIDAAGGSAAVLVGLNPLAGFVAMGLVAAGTMELFGVQRPRGRDVATGIVLGAALGAAALFLYLDTTVTSTTGATTTILFGSVFTLDPSILPVLALCSLGIVGALVALFRPLVLSSVSPELARARGVRVRTVGVCFLLTMSVAVALAAVTIGAILSTALLVGPAATALRLVRRPWAAVAVSAGCGLAATWLGIVLAYESYSWPPVGHGWPASFLIVALVFTAYLAAGVPARWRERRQTRADVGLVRSELAGAPVHHGTELAGGR